jgi:hypothetical protein
MTGLWHQSDLVSTLRLVQTVVLSETPSSKAPAVVAATFMHDHSIQRHYCSEWSSLYICIAAQHTQYTHCAVARNEELRVQSV